MPDKLPHRDFYELTHHKFTKTRAQEERIKNVITIKKHKRWIIKKQNVSNYTFRKPLDIMAKNLIIIQCCTKKT